MFKLLTEPMLRTVFWAKVHAAKNGRQLAARDDVLFGLAHEWPALQEKLNLPPVASTPQEAEEMKKAIQLMVDLGQRADGMDNPFDTTCREAFHQALKSSLEGAGGQMTLRHFLVAFAQEDKWVMRTLEDKGVNPSELRLESTNDSRGDQ